MSSYPTYEEWKHMKLLISLIKNWVLILPMRNGNGELQHLQQAAIFSSRSYPTYEEWKPITGMNVNSSSFVLILPMRNGNPAMYPKSSNSSL